MSYFFIDFEASSLLPGSYPIEVGVVRNDGWGKRWLIAPHKDWIEYGNWDYNAEDIHGLSRDECISDGTPVDQVAEELISIRAQGLLFSDASYWDQGWLDTLLEYAYSTETIRILNLTELHGELVKPMLQAGAGSEARHLISSIETDDELFQIQLECGFDERTGDPDRRILRHRALADCMSMYRVALSIQNAVVKWQAMNPHDAS